MVFDGKIEARHFASVDVFLVFEEVGFCNPAVPSTVWKVSESAVWRRIPWRTTVNEDSAQQRTLSMRIAPSTGVFTEIGEGFRQVTDSVDPETSE